MAGFDQLKRRYRSPADYAILGSEAPAGRQTRRPAGRQEICRTPAERMPGNPARARNSASAPTASHGLASRRSNRVIKPVLVLQSRAAYRGKPKQPRSGSVSERMAALSLTSSAAPRSRRGSVRPASAVRAPCVAARCAGWCGEDPRDQFSCVHPDQRQGPVLRPSTYTSCFRRLRYLSGSPAVHAASGGRRW
jgi:hypothetical protein